MTCRSQSECFISVWHSYSKTKDSDWLKLVKWLAAANQSALFQCSVAKLIHIGFMTLAPAGQWCLECRFTSFVVFGLYGENIFGRVMMLLSVSRWLLHNNHCDQMAKLSFQYWAINKNENLSNLIKICTNWVQYFVQCKTNPQRFLKFCQSGEISPILVTLLTTNAWSI